MLHFLEVFLHFFESVASQTPPGAFWSKHVAFSRGCLLIMLILFFGKGSH